MKLEEDILRYCLLKALYGVYVVPLTLRGLHDLNSQHYEAPLEFIAPWLTERAVCSTVTEQLSKLAPSECPHLVLQAMAGPLAAATASTVTNPMDVVRARVQVCAPSAGSFKVAGCRLPFQFGIKEYILQNIY